MLSGAVLDDEMDEILRGKTYSGGDTLRQARFSC